MDTPTRSIGTAYLFRLAPPRVRIYSLASDEEYDTISCWCSRRANLESRSDEDIAGEAVGERKANAKPGGGLQATPAPQELQQGRGIPNTS